MTFLELVMSADEQTFAEIVNAQHKELCAKSPSHIGHHQELLRAKWCIWLLRHESIASAPRRYNFPQEMYRQLVGEAVEPAQKRQKRSDKYETVKQWCLDNHLVQTNVNEIAEIGAFSYPTALKFITDRPDLFYKIKRGVYEARNPNISKEEEKTRLEK